MRNGIRWFWMGVLMLGGGLVRGGTFDVRKLGAVGDGVQIDSGAVNKGIEEAGKEGGGVVVVPAGRYLCGSIHLRSGVELRLEKGAVIEAIGDAGKYDKAEVFEGKAYQDYGHSHWHDGLIWGENLHDVSITGEGMIWGKGLVTSNDAKNDRGNKAISLKWCRNVTLKDFTIKEGGWFGILATGVDNLVVSHLRIDTNRDGMDIDCCKNVVVSGCLVNSPNDDGICLKSTLGLGVKKACENVVIGDCVVSGYEVGSVLDGTFKVREVKEGKHGPTGRIKLGTESNGGFKNVAISNCIFDHCFGLAIEEVDGGDLEDVVVSNLTMREIGSSPIFLRLGARLRGPEGTEVGHVRRVMISNVNVFESDGRYGIIVAGIPGHKVEDVVMSGVRIVLKGGVKGDGKREIGEMEKKYPEPTMFGETPAYGLWGRHVEGLVVRDLVVKKGEGEGREEVVMEDGVVERKE